MPYALRLPHKLHSGRLQNNPDGTDKQYKGPPPHLLLVLAKHAPHCCTACASHTYNAPTPACGERSSASVACAAHFKPCFELGCERPNLATHQLQKRSAYGANTRPLLRPGFVACMVPPASTSRGIAHMVTTQTPYCQTHGATNKCQALHEHTSHDVYTSCMPRCKAKPQAHAAHQNCLQWCCCICNARSKHLLCLLTPGNSDKLPFLTAEHGSCKVNTAASCQAAGGVHVQ